MAVINLDLSRIQESGLKILEKGIYSTRVSEAEMLQNHRGNWTLMLNFVINGENYDEFVVSDEFILESTLDKERLKGALIALRHPNPNYLKLTEELIDLECRISVDRITDDTKTEINKIREYRPLHLNH